jgi:hypothetical protein
MRYASSIALRVYYLCTLASPVSAGNVSGTVNTTTWTADQSPYRVVGKVTVPAGDTLTIEPGVDVIFNVVAQFAVEGALTAVGTQDSSIRFMTGGATEWAGVQFSGGDSSLLVHVSISDGNASGRFSAGERGGGIGAYGTNTRVGFINCVLQQNNASLEGAAIYAGDGAFVTMETCIIRDHVTDGAYGTICANSASIYAINCAITNNSGFQAGSAYYGVSGGTVDFGGKDRTRTAAGPVMGSRIHRVGTGG